MTPDLVILFGHGSRDPRWAEPMEKVRDLIGARAGAPAVVLAYLEFMHPTIDEALDAAVRAGHRSVRVAPMFLGQGGHLRRDLAAKIDAARVRHPQLVLDVLPAFGEDAEILAAVAAWAAR